MNKNENFVITINRELGSGGRTVGRLLAEKLNVPYYDKALIKALQKEYHLTVEEIEKLKGRKHSWWADVQRILNIGPGVTANYYLPQKGDEPDLLTTDEMFKTETLILQNLAKEKSCGRSQRVPCVPYTPQSSERPHPGLHGVPSGAHHAQAERYRGRGSQDY